MSQIDTAHFARLIMDFLRQDDDMGLWEPLWELNTRYPDTAPSERQTVAAQTLRELHAGRAIELYRSQYPDDDNAVPALTDEEAQAEIGATWWHAVPPHPGGVWIRATPASDIANPS